MVVGAAGHQLHSPLHKAVRQGGGIFHHLLLVGLELRLERLPQGHRLGGDDMHQRAALGAGENGGVELLGKVFVVGQQHAAPGPPEGLMGSGGHHMGVGHGRGVQPGGHQPRDMGHIHPQVGPHLVRDGPEPLEVNDPWIGGGPGDNHAGPALLGHPFQRVVVDASGGLVYAIGYHLKIFTGLPWVRWPPWSKFMPSTVSPG